MNVNVTGPFIYFTIPIFGGIPITQTTVSSFIVTGLLVWFCLYMGKRLKKRPDGLQVLVEKGVMMMHGMVIDTMGKHNAHWTPVIITLFVSSITGRLIGMTGFLRSTTADLSTVIVWAVMVSVIIWTNTIKKDGLGSFLKNYINPMNLVSDIAQPASMALRHFGNVAGGGVITSILYTALAGLSAAIINLVASSVVMPFVVLALGATLIVFGKKKAKLAMLIFGVVCAVLGLLGLLQFSGIVKDVPVLQVGIPAVLSIYFDLFSGFVQALVFSLLSMVYIAGSCPAPDEAA